MPSSGYRSQSTGCYGRRAIRDLISTLSNRFLGEKSLNEGIFRHQRKEVTGIWGKMHNMEFHNLHSLDVFIKLWMRPVGHIANTGQIKEIRTSFYFGNLKERDFLDLVRR
jgi:hypothetical protein